MIEGLKIVISTEELSKVLTERGAFHKEKWEFYLKQAEDFRKQEEELPQEMQNTSNSPARGLTDKAKEHQQKASYFNFMAEHLAPGEKYQLSESDLQKMEIISRYF